MANEVDDPKNTSLEGITQAQARQLLEKRNDLRTKAALGATLGTVVAAAIAYVTHVPYDLVLTCGSAALPTVAALDIYLVHQNEIEDKLFDYNTADYCRDYLHRKFIG